jgi:N-acyl-D-aspartate/D-glutamate deacylase
MRTFSFVLLIAMLAAVPLAAQDYDLLITNGRLLDGSGNPWYYADVGVRGDRIVAVGRLEGATARRVIDATGLYVAPGFIDVHTHAGTGLVRENLSHAEPLLAQGITMALLNPDGGGAVDLAQQRVDLLEHGLGINVGLLVPHGSVRRAVLGMEDRAPTAEELDRMRALVRAGMEEGAYGMSAGPYYAPGSYSETNEHVELAKVVAEYDGAYTSHIRDEADYNIGVVAAVDEVITVAREAGLPGIVTHIKALGPRVWGYSMAMIQRMENARSEGIEVFADQYPYEAGGTSITGALIPRWAQVGGGDSLNQRLTDPDQRARVRADILENLDRRGGAHLLQFRHHAPDPSIEGRTLQAVADEREMHPADLAMDLQLAGGAGLVTFAMIEDDIQLFMRNPWVMTSSDGGLVPLGEGVPHPRYYGSFPRKIRRYVIERETIELPMAIRSMTSLSATVFRIADRGAVRPGAFADIVVFDLESLTDRATYSDPHHYCEGMQFVVVNGELAIADGEFTDAMPGRVVQRAVRQ